MTGRKLEEILLIAHRGASKLAPENTLKAFEKAIELGADYVEFDVHISKDGEIVIMHDSTVDRTTGGKGTIEEMTLKELKDLDCGEGEKIPTLQDLIELAKDKIGLQLEIKAKGMAEKIVHLVREAGLIESIIISSFDHDELLEIKRIEPSIKLASLILGVKKKSSIKEAIDNGFHAIHPMDKFASSKFIASAHEHGIKVNVWTVDSKSKMRKLIEKGVDGIITNDVEAAREVLGRN